MCLRGVCVCVLCVGEYSVGLWGVNVCCVWEFGVCLWGVCVCCVWESLLWVCKD